MQKLPFKTITTGLLLCACMAACKKNSTPAPCNPANVPVYFREVLTDTAFEADTVFRDNEVEFSTGGYYENVTWKLAGDPAVFTQRVFTRNMQNAYGPVTAFVSAADSRQPACGQATGSRSVVMLEQQDRALLTLSPLRGSYRGAFTHTPAAMFTFTIGYFDSAKYNVSITGSRNFYWLSNMPDGFTGTTPAATAYPELRNGMAVEMGYKCFAFGASASSQEQGRGWLRGDSIFIVYGNAVNGYKKFTGKKI